MSAHLSDGEAQPDVERGRSHRPSSEAGLPAQPAAAVWAARRMEKRRRIELYRRQVGQRSFARDAPILTFVVLIDPDLS